MKEIGRGAYGIIYADKDPRWAWKTFTAENDLKCMRELFITRRLTHQNIISYDKIRILKLEPPPAQLVVRMPKYDIPLSRYKARSEVELAMIMKSLLDALMYCHANSVLHRDVKEENVLLKFDEVGGNIKNVVLCDFGLANIYSGIDKWQTRKVSTISHRAPEIQIALVYDLRMRYDARVDIWSLCIIFANMICKVPFFKYIYDHRHVLLTDAVALSTTGKKNSIRRISREYCGGDEATFVTLLVHPELFYHWFNVFLETQKRSDIEINDRFISAIKKGICPYPERATTSEIHETLFDVMPARCISSNRQSNRQSKRLLGREKYDETIINRDLFLIELQHYHVILGHPKIVYDMSLRFIGHLSIRPSESIIEREKAIACYLLAEYICLDHPSSLRSTRKFWELFFVSSLDLTRIVIETASALKYKISDDFA
jgi:serine/threonine protein kinase